MVPEADQPRQLTAAEIRMLVEHLGRVLAEFLVTYAPPQPRVAEVELQAAAHGRASIEAVVIAADTATFTESATVKKIYVDGPTAAPSLTDQERYLRGLRVAVFLFILSEALDWDQDKSDRITMLVEWLLNSLL